MDDPMGRTFIAMELLERQRCGTGIAAGPLEIRKRCLI